MNSACFSDPVENFWHSVAFKTALTTEVLLLWVLKLMQDWAFMFQVFSVYYYFLSLGLQNQCLKRKPVNFWETNGHPTGEFSLGHLAF